MRKKLLLLAAVLSASASITLAQEKTVYSDDNNIIYTYSANSDVTITAQGQNSLDSENNRENIILGSTLSIDYVSYTRVANRNRDIKLTVSDINDYSILPSQLQSFSRAVVSGEDLTNEDLNTTLSSFATDNRLNYPRTQRNNLPPSEMYYKIRQNTNAEKAAYATYQNACEKARTRGLYVYTGAELLEEGVDFDLYHMQINEGLYYIDAPNAVDVILIDATTGNWKEGTTYLNCTDNFIPTYIGSNIPLPTTTASDEDSKVGIVSGLVDNGKVEEILANDDYKYLNFDFTNANILGSVATDIHDNRIAYFAKNTDATGQNIVVGSTCESYVISDNNQEIYVSKAFSAGESQYKRTFTPDTYGTIVLPFAVNNPSNVFVRQAVFTGYSSAENKMTFTCTSMIAPNTPHLFKVLPTVAGESTLYGPVNGTIEATAEAKSAKYEGAQFAGTFEGLRAEIASQVYVVGAVGKIGRTTKALKPGRCYFTREDSGNFARSFGGATIEFIDEDGTTAINEHELNESHELSGAVYNLQGRRVENPTKGLYIVNGKKVVIK
ncbi:hypothetical protein M1D30_10760 [Prevotella sp. E15-22]|uniref:hypothetical protein n=1 Tax=Prevotella sp. E15-22 TaxID=2937774 RepID=UPI002069C8FC|nr:hypothetical protein [Prevotella sp. E15-22]UPS44046.1 hypothetical protein M1D30_10760 [Prevotella sp. E15-22]